MSESPPLKLCLFGAAGDTGNLGVSALLHATLGAVAQRAPDAAVTVFDNGWGVRPAETRYGEQLFRYDLCGARLSKRLHRPESFWNMRLAAKLGGWKNAGAKRVLEADAVWDVSGGDSFSDLYGAKVLEAIATPKELALEHGIPLVLLPQTYGPFRTEEARSRARAILCGATLAWARDERSFVLMKDLLGAAFDPERHRLGVDVAFLLRPREPKEMPEEIRRLLDPGHYVPTVGLNVSGLVYNDPAAREKFGLVADYRAVVEALVRKLLSESGANILLIPHVLVGSGTIESDADACQAVLDSVPADQRQRVLALPPMYDQSESKWVLSQLDWFCGTRMHPCIGALSSGVPTASIAYSLKTKGVFETCDLGDHVLELRSQSEDEIVAGIWRSWTERDAAREALARRLPEVVHQAENQIDVTLAKSGGALTATRASTQRRGPGDHE